MRNGELVAMLKAVAEPSRLRILDLLTKTPDGMAAGAIAAMLEFRQNTLSSHLKTLTRSGLIVGTREGRRIVYALDGEQAQRIVDGLARAFAAKG
jgi:ArsR family transcriptional regulator, arsenate/arsenite/antimonite-responsive transcriptional repressor